MTRTGTTPGQAKMCAALALASRDEEEVARTVSETIEHIWSLCHPTANDKFKIIPHALVNHCSAPLNVIIKEEILPLFINHLRVQENEDLFCNNQDIPCIDVNRNIATLTEKYLPAGSRYHYSKEYNQFARTFFNKIHCCCQEEEREMKERRDEKTEPMRGNTPTREDEQGQDNEMSIEEIAMEIKRYENESLD
jgi:hypothetical protein